MQSRTPLVHLVKENNMARKITPTAKSTMKTASTRSGSTLVATKPAAISTPVRNSAIPKTVSLAKKPAMITHEAISRRAYEIYLSGTGGNETDNWLRAERELRGKL
jgi:hypothetical protein